MEKGKSLSTRMIMKYLTTDSKKEIENLINDMSLSTFERPNFNSKIRHYEDDLTDTELMTIRSYTGYNFRNINAVLRDTWTYDLNGKLTEEEKEKYATLSCELAELIERFPKTTSPFLTYRGTTIYEFHKYNIDSLDDLLSLKDNYLYEKGFTSTSLDEESCYFNKMINGVDINIEIKYIIPNDSNEGIPLLTDNSSYSKNQQEYLLNKNTLSKVLDVKIDKDNAIITVLVIPKTIWNKQENELENRK
jgi:hypothetical protein